MILRGHVRLNTHNGHTSPIGSTPHNGRVETVPAFFLTEQGIRRPVWTPVELSNTVRWRLETRNWLTGMEQWILEFNIGSVCTLNC